MSTLRLPRTRKAFLAVLLALVAVVLATEACSPQSLHARDAVLDAAKIACVIANAFQPPELLRTICEYDEKLDEPMRKIAAQHRDAVVAARQSSAVGACASASGSARPPAPAASQK
jgi:homoserine kinase